MFRKPKNRNIRQRQRADTDDEETPVKPAAVELPKKEEADSDPDDEIQHVVTNVTVKKKSVQLISFDQDEGNDTEEFKIKKPSMRKRTERLLRKQREYEKKQKEFEDAKKYDIEKDLGLVIKNPITGKSRIDNIDRDFGEQVEDEVIIEAVKESMETNSYMGIEGIPDARTVYEAKKKREQMRRDGVKVQTNEEAGFIPLSGSTKTEKVAHSRLVREDDNDVSDEDGEAASSQFYSSKSLLITEEERRRKEQEEFMLVEGDSDEDDENGQTEEDEEARRKAKESDDEFAEWETHQIRKAVSTKKVKQMKYENHAVTNDKMEPEIVTLEDDDDMDIDISSSAQTVVKNIPSLTNLKLSNITDKLKLQIEDKKNYIAAQTYDLQRKTDTVYENDKMIVGIEDDYPKLREKFRLYQEMKLYTKDLLDCVNEKLDSVVDMENRILNMWKTRAERLIKRRRNDVTDQYNKCLALAKHRPWQPESDVSQREANREARRSYRRIQREKVGLQADHKEGMSSDEDEPESQQFEYQRTMAESLETAAYVFHDASEEFSDVGLIVSKYADWLLVDHKSFEEAYIGMCLPKLLSPFIRLELLDWNPLRDASRPVFMFNWYKRVLVVGTDKVGFDLEHGVVVNLIPDILDKLLLPRITKVITEQWDPYSLSQSRNLSYMITLLIDESPTLTGDSKNVKNMLKAVLDKFKASVNDDSDVPVFGKDALLNSATGCLAFFNRRFWSIIKLIKSANCFKNILSKKYMQEIVLDGFINKSIVMMLHFLKDFPATVDKCLAVMDEIPTEWLTPAPEDPTSFASLVNALKRVMDANSDAPNVRKISKFVAKIER